jgi:hypothetical protein
MTFRYSAGMHFSQMKMHNIQDHFPQSYMYKPMMTLFLFPAMMITKPERRERPE